MFLRTVILLVIDVSHDPLLRHTTPALSVPSPLVHAHAASASEANTSVVASSPLHDSASQQYDDIESLDSFFWDDESDNEQTNINVSMAEDSDFDFF